MPTNKVPLFAVCLLSIVLSSCSGLHDVMSEASGLGVVSGNRSTFDGSESVTMSPAPIYSQNYGGNALFLGAAWNAKYSDQVGFALEHKGNTSYGSTYLGIRGLDINIDGKISSYSVAGGTDFTSGSYNSVTKTIYTQSKNIVIVPLSVLRKMMNANDCRIRIRTSQGSEDRIFSQETNGGMKMAKAHMRKFLSKVDSMNR